MFKSTKNLKLLFTLELVQKKKQYLQTTFFHLLNISNKKLGQTVNRNCSQKNICRRLSTFSPCLFVSWFVLFSRNDGRFTHHATTPKSPPQVSGEFSSPLARHLDTQTECRVLFCYLTHSAAWLYWGQHNIHLIHLIHSVNMLSTWSSTSSHWDFSLRNYVLQLFSSGCRGKVSSFILLISKCSLVLSRRNVWLCTVPK